jgi:hypothetical protein
VFSVASKLAHLLRRHPVLLVVLLVVIAMVAASWGHGHPVGLWDGPI